MGSKDISDKFPYFLFKFFVVHMQYYTTVSCNEILPAL